MLFARSYLEPQKTGITQKIFRRAEDEVRRGYSHWDKGYNPTVDYEEGSFLASMNAEEWINLPPETQREINRRAFLEEQADGRLPGLCAVRAALSYSELVEEIRGCYKDRYFYSPDGQNCFGAGIIALFEGDLVGTDPEGWPLFKATKLLGIADLKTIVRDAAATPAAHGPGR
jgi:hypothetical protein